MRTVFLSSTAKDLSACREAAYKAIEGLQGYHCLRMEDFGSWNVNPDDFCRAKVGDCDVFVCMAGPLYGSRTPAGPSYTEREFDAAVTSNRPCLVFMTAEDFALPANLIESEDNRDRQAAFRTKLSSGRIIARFSDPQEVAVLVVQAIRNWEASLAGGSTGGNRSMVRIRRLKPQAESKWLESAEAVITIGRSPESFVRIDDPEVSWEHGQILRMKGQYYYRHLSDTNPTVIERRGAQILMKKGRKIEAILYNQDRLTMGNAGILVAYDLIGVDDGYIPTAKRPEE